MGTPLGPKYIPYTYMDPLGLHNPLEGVVLRTEPTLPRQAQLFLRCRDLGFRVGNVGFRVYV